MSSLSDHAYPMHLHMYPYIAQLNLCLSSLGLVCASARSEQELLCLFFADPDFQEQWCWTQAFHGAQWQHQVLLWSKVKMQLPSIASVGHPIPMAWASTKGFSISLHEASRQPLYPWLPPWEESLVVRWAVFQHAVGDIAGTKIGFIVTFFIKSINSPTNDLNAFSWPLL